MAACCPFCNLSQERIVAVSEHMRAIRDAFPISPGHTLLLPRRHVGSLFDLTVVEWVELGQLLARSRTALQAEFRPDGFNVGVNEGVAAGQTVPHLHVHLIPRYQGDRPDPRGGIRWIFPDKARYWSP
ncbi:HIT family protein [Candidatus Competibacter phosphatis]|uniref:HIT family protein n=1 Tax=Candidatus Competibacter phosphatis TaxID=221280 RepID=A0ABX1THX1_9GAMM|nr:HIT family protein [Candidatus Competibacter phosphatis]NMQ18065.1 HIT family protein [Candidatus Competibacter phosphatis]